MNTELVWAQNIYDLHVQCCELSIYDDQETMRLEHKMSGELSAMMKIANMGVPRAIKILEQAYGPSGEENHV